MFGGLIEQMKIFVSTLAGETITVKVDPSDTINVVKAKIQDQERLLFGKMELDDRRTLADYGIADESTLNLGLGTNREMQIFVKGLNGKTISIWAKELDTIGSVKAKIHALNGIPPDDQCLTYGGRGMIDDRTLKDSGITNEATLHLSLRLRSCKKCPGHT
ncbi:hypothetical protein QYE76_058321 [Lolium multiflorum]|uniref:Ubiquitin-like domain-containing protein n=1 Tax=Lolium multiflorum TaxID=4521 RepID=A0AAD8WPS7_LOLMU|nr:hypothetical protein QYE76_058321 [Lolium multiflorum]